MYEFPTPSDSGNTSLRYAIAVTNHPGGTYFQTERCVIATTAAVTATIAAAAAGAARIANAAACVLSIMVRETHWTLFW